MLHNFQWQLGSHFQYTQSRDLKDFEFEADQEANGEVD
jgi:hypothetical protein